jgi:hypothetical protein
MNSTFSNTENTKIYNSFHGWTGETKVKVNGKNWVLTTMKRHSGTIGTHCHVVQDEGNGSYSFMMFGDNDPKENFWLNILPKGTKATEKTIREAHFKALAEFDQKSEAGELPSAKEEYKIEVGQVIFTDGYENSYRRAIYKIEGTRFYTVLLDGSNTRIDTHIRPWSKKFGIGVYYREGDKVSPEQVENLLIDAHRNMELKKAADEAQRIINEQQAKAKAEYLSQFQKADRRTTTNIIKRHILKTWPQVQKVEVKTDVFSGGDSQDVTYYAPERIEALETFVRSFREGHFNSMEDLYEYDSDKSEIILEGHILQTYKYSSAHFEKAEPKAEQLPPPPAFIITAPLAFEMVNYSDKALAVFGETKPIKEQLKQIGGRFNPFLNHNGSKKAGWIFSKSKEQELKKLLNL